MKLDSAPIWKVPPITMLPPNHSAATMQPYMHICIRGWLSCISFSARYWAARTASALSSNLSDSYFSRTKAFTTRMAMRFSCTSELSKS